MCGRGDVASSNDARVFKALDDYARNKHQCFLAEMFLNDTGTEYILCFRPADGSKNSPGRFACRYLRIQMSEIGSVVQTETIPISLAEELDRELLALRQSI